MGFLSYLLTTPDGQQWDLQEEKWRVDIGIPDGFDLAQIAHDTQVLYNQPGALLKSVQMQPRTVTITANLAASCRDELHQIRAALWQALRWNREGKNPPSYSTLRYEANNSATELNCYFLSEVVSGGDGETAQVIGYKLIAYDPLWYGVTPNEQELLLYTTLASKYMIAKIDGVWQVPGGGQGAGAAGSTVYDYVWDSKGRLYACGSFTTIGGVAASRIAYSDDNGVTWNAMGAGLAGGTTCGYKLAIDSRDRVYVAGEFNTVDGIASVGVGYWDGSWHAMNGLNQYCFAIAISSSDVVYVGGDFVATSGAPANCNYIAYWNGSAWAPLGTGMSDRVRGLAFAPDGTLYVGGFFATGNAVTLNKIGKWNGTTFAAMGTGIAGAGTPYVRSVIVAKDGSVYITGYFSTASGITCNRVARWNGVQWFPLGAGLTVAAANGSLQGEYLYEMPDGRIFVCGYFQKAGTLALTDRAAFWNGTAFSQVDWHIVHGNDAQPVVLKVNPVTGDLWEGHMGSGLASGTVICAGNITSVVEQGDAEAYPVITVTGAGTLNYIENTTSQKTMLFNVTLNAGEVATIDLSPLAKSFVSSLRGDLFRFSTLLPVSDFASWSLEPKPFAPAGANSINVYMTNTTPTEQNDNNNQLSGWENITGIATTNTDNGRLYVSIVADGGGFYHVNLYSDLARSHLVGHTATYNSNGAKAIVADNLSGLGGTVTVDARTAADTDIVVFFAVAKIEWYDRFLSADSAVAPDRIR